MIYIMTLDAMKTMYGSDPKVLKSIIREKINQFQATPPTYRCVRVVQRIEEYKTILKELKNEERA